MLLFLGKPVIYVRLVQFWLRFILLMYLVDCDVQLVLFLSFETNRHQFFQSLERVVSVEKENNWYWVLTYEKLMISVHFIGLIWGFYLKMPPFLFHEGNSFASEFFCMRSCCILVSVWSMNGYLSRAEVGFGRLSKGNTIKGIVSSDSKT